jgi:cytochrome c oxidase cbb3-type subunit 3
MSVCLLGMAAGVFLPVWAHTQNAPPQSPPANTPAQQPEPTQEPPAHGNQPQPERPAPFPAQQRPPASPEVLARGKAMYATTCAACHGADARGGQLGGVNLLRSPLMLGDKDGELVMPIVKQGRPGTAMVAIPMPDADIKAVVAYIHSLQAQGSNQGAPPPGPEVALNVLVGNAKDGEAFFASTCTACHSAGGDLAGIASRVEDAKALQNLWVSGGRTMGAGAGRRRTEPSPRQRQTVKVTLPGGEVVEGQLVRVDDFLVTVGLADGTTRTIRREGDTPKVEITNPLARHDALLAVYTNKNVQDLTAYLATLK